MSASRFLAEVLSGDWPRPAGVQIARLGANLHGSIAFTGIGHATDRTVMLGLAGEMPATIDPGTVDAIIAQIMMEKSISPPGHPVYRFDPSTDLVLDRKVALPGHANALSFQASGHLEKPGSFEWIVIHSLH